MKKRNAFTMKILPGQAEEYKRRHDEIWPELQSLLSDHGVSDYSIFLDEATLTLFAYQIVDTDHDQDQIPHQEIVKKWWSYMADIMETNEDNSPKTWPLREVFHMD